MLQNKLEYLNLREIKQNKNILTNKKNFTSNGTISVGNVKIKKPSTRNSS